MESRESYPLERYALHGVQSSGRIGEPLRDTLLLAINLGEAVPRIAVRDRATIELLHQL